MPVKKFNAVDGVSVGADQVPVISDTGAVTATTVSGTLTTANQPNITGLGPLTGLAVSGTVSAAAFSGSGSGLNNLLASALMGTLSPAIIADGSLPSQKLVSGSVSATQLADGSVNNSKLQDGSVTDNKIAGGTISGGKLQGGTVTDSQLSGTGVVAGSYTNPNITVSAQGRVTGISSGGASFDQTWWNNNYINNGTSFFQRLPSGLIIQGGFGAGGFNTFIQAFPNACLAVTVCTAPRGGASGNGANYADQVDRTQFYMVVDPSPGTGYYIAVGY